MTRRRATRALTVTALLAPLAPLATAQEFDPRAALEAAVDLPTPAARRAAALALAVNKAVSLEQWLDVAAQFGRFDAVPPGVLRETVDLPVGDATETTELFVYVPAGYDAAVAAPLLLVGHGTGGSGNGQHRAWRPVADQLGMLVLSPSEAGPNGGYGYTERERQAVRAALRWARRRFHVDENRIFATGISRGGHLVWDLALRDPDRFAAIAPMVGGPRLNIAAGQNNLRFAENVATLPIRDLQGSGDHPLLLFNLRLLFEKLAALQARDAQLIEFPDRGHSFDMAAVDWAEFWGGARRDPTPTAVVRQAAQLRETRAFWIEVTKLEKSIQETFRLKVPHRKWEALDDHGKRRFMQEQVDAKTARLAVEQTAPGAFTARGRGVVKFRLLLTDAMRGDGRHVTVTFNNKRRRKTPRPNARVLLLEFVERFDRTFLPTAEVVVP